MRGDCTICTYCKNILEFDKKLRLIPARKATLKKVSGQSNLIENTQLASILSDQIKEERS